MAYEEDVRIFLERQRVLLAKEREAEIERSSLLLSNCGPKLLEQKGLAIVGLGVVGINIGLGGKTLIELERPSAYHTSPIFPPHNLRSGDLARIEANVLSSTAKKSKPGATPIQGSQVEGVVYKVSDTRIVIAVDSAESSSDDLELPERCRVVKLANSITYDRMDKAIDQLEKTVLPKGDGTPSPAVTPLVQVLLGLKSPSPQTRADNLSFFDPNLNESQKAAVRFCLESPEVSCIHGPPGTGKTHTLIEIIRQLTSETPSNPKARRVLVCGASNLSVDNILERLLALPVTNKAQALKITRIGHPARVMAHEGILNSTLEVKSTMTDQAALARDVKEELNNSLGILSGKGKGVKGKGPRGAERRKMWEEVKALRKECAQLGAHWETTSDKVSVIPIRYRQREGSVVKSVLNESQVVVSTCHSSGGRQLFNQDFDVVIIDEATQALEAVCWIPIFKGKKLILAGDPMQLPPTVLSLNTSKTNKSENTKAPRINAKSTQQPQSHASTSDLSDDSGSDSFVAEDSADNQVQPVKSASLRNDSPIKLRPSHSLETTLFDRLEKMYGSRIKRMLEIQYRMHDQICSFPSKTLYGSKLKSHSSVASHLLRDLPNVHAENEEDEKEILETPVVFFDTAGCEYFERLDGDADEGSRCNENEATIVHNWIIKLVDTGITPSQIAVITPYQAQVTLLTSLLRPKYGPSLEIGTVDGMQGREKDVIIISLVRSNDTREVGFLKEKRRMNVAMTRAKRHLCVVGDSSTVCHGGSYLKKWLAWLEDNADVKYAGLE